MKKLITLIALLALAVGASAQKFALIDMEYVLKNIPAYERANFQNEALFLSAEAKKAAQEEIMQLEKKASDLKRKYFGPEGELFKKRESLMTPIQEEIYTAVKEISELRGYALVIDRASDTAIIFGSPKIDISNEVLQKLGYAN